jgi:hypothetical protein
MLAQPVNAAINAVKPHRVRRLNAVVGVFLFMVSPLFVFEIFQNLFPPSARIGNARRCRFVVCKAVYSVLCGFLESTCPHGLETLLGLDAASAQGGYQTQTE